MKAVMLMFDTLNRRSLSVYGNEWIKTPNFDRLAKIRNKVSIPLVLHGASDISADVVQKTIAMGICKVNVATDLKNAFFAAMTQFIQENPQESDPRKYNKPAEDAMAEVIKAKILMCGSNEKA